MTSPASGQVWFHDLRPEVGSLRQEALSGLRRQPKTLPAKFLYDRRGSELFDQITLLPEYYPTRTETSILTQHRSAILEHLGPRCVLIEFGSGSSVKTRILLDHMVDIAAYVPIDISRSHLQESARELVQRYPHLKVIAVCADYTRPLELPVRPVGGRTVIFFPGSSIGNFEPEAARAFLRNAAAALRPGDGLLIGADLKKDPAILHAAYNDGQGVTAAFNLNILRRLNRELGANFNLDRFTHQAFFNAGAGRVEMHLLSRTAQTVALAGAALDFQPGETIHTENSYKFDVTEFQDLATAAGWRPVRYWTDPDQLFSVHYLEVP